MRRIFSKVFVLSLFIVLLAFIHKDAVFADYTMTIIPEDIHQPTSLSPTPDPSKTIDENTRTITITFHGLVSDKDYFLCLEDVSPRNCESDLVNVGKPDSNDNITKNFCADGKDTLKLSEDDGEAQCDDKDYFWGGHTYRAAILRKDPTRVIDEAPIYVSHYFPKISVSPLHPSPDDDPIQVTIEGTRRRHDKEGRNNYAVEIHDQSGKLRNTCKTVTDTQPAVADLGTWEAGDYLIKINEQVSEDNIVANNCSAGYTYYTLGVHIKTGGGSFDRNPDGSLALTPDPNGTDLQGPQKTFPTPPLPCLTLSPNGGCDTVKTAIGNINTNPAGFIKSIFSLILSISGGLALLLIIYSGYQLMVARGNPEALQAARDQLIAAIVGLVFIIFSLVILQVIGVDILRIPGFGG